MLLLLQLCYFYLIGVVFLGEKYFLKDSALITKTNDAFHHEDYVKNLKKIIEEHDPPYNIALIGKWGVGKSSIINLLKEELKGKEEIATHEINAWKYENESLKKAFLKNLWQTFNKNENTSFFKLFAESLRETSVQATIDDKLSSRWNITKMFFSMLSIFILLFLLSSVLILVGLYLWDGINAIFTKNTFIENAKDSFQIFKKNIWIAIIAAPLFKIFQDLLKSSLQSKMADVRLIKPIETADEYEELFKEAIANHKKENNKFRKLVVIVDDLDRLSTKKVVSALDAIKAFVEINECIFIVTCDENILIKALEKEKLNNSNDIDGELFLDKLFHFRIALPPIIENDMTNYALKLSKQEAPGLVRLCGEQFEDIINILIHAEVNTPRHVKKLLNNFTNNLLIATSREANNRKLESDLLTGDEGKKFLAKLTVIQTDYHEVYLELGKDFSYFDDFIDFYQNPILINSDTKISIKNMFNKKESTYYLKPSKESLINFLIKYQHISVENIAPFIYLAQDAIGLKAGDEKQRAIRKNLISGNEKAIINLLNENPNKENLISAIVEEVKNSTTKDLPFVLKTSVQLIDFMENQKKDMSLAVSNKLSSIKFNQIQLWQINFKNWVEIYNYSNNKIHIGNMILFILDELFLRSTDWRNKKNKEMNEQEFIDEISYSLNMLLLNSSVLSTEIKFKIKQFIAFEQNEYSFYPFQEIQKLYKVHLDLYDEYFGLPFFNQLITEIQNSEDQQLEQNMNTFFEVAPKISMEYTNDFLRLLPIVISSGKNDNVIDVIDLLQSFLDRVSKTDGTKIIESILKHTFSEYSEVSYIFTTLKNIPLNDINNEEFKESLNSFIIENLKELNNHSSEDSIIRYVENYLLKYKIDFGYFDDLYIYLLEELILSNEYDSFLNRINDSLTENQRQKLFDKKINPIISFTSYDESQFDRAFSLLKVLLSNSKNDKFMQNMINNGIQYFRNNSSYQKPLWENDFIKLFSISSKLIETDILINFVDALFNYSIPQQRNSMAIKAFKYIGENIPESVAKKAINYVIKNSDDDLQKLDSMEFTISCHEHISEDNNNISEHIDFIVNNFSIKPDLFLEELYLRYDRINENSLIRLIELLDKLEKDKLMNSLELIQKTTAKFFMKLDEEIRQQVVIKLIGSEISSQIVNISLLKSLSDVISIRLLNQVIESNAVINYNSKILLLEICAPYSKSITKLNLSNLILDILNTKEDDYIIRTCNLLLDKYSTFRFNREKKNISNQILPIFKSVNVESKVKLLELSKRFNLTQVFEKAIKDKLFTEQEEKLTAKVFNSRKKF